MREPTGSGSAAAPPRSTTRLPREAFPLPIYAWYAVGVLTLAYLFSFLDR